MSATHGIVEEKAGPFSSSRDLQVHALLTLLAQQKIYRFFVEAMKERAKENGFDSIREIWKIVKPDATESELEGAELD